LAMRDGKTALHRLVEAGLRLFGFDHFYTIKGKETRSGSSPRGPGPTGSGQDPTRYGKGFIRAEVCALGCTYRTGFTRACREKGLLQIEGRDYVVQDGDVILVQV